MQINFGKLFIVGFEGTELNESISQKLKALDPAGVILYDTNIRELEQVKSLIRDLKALLGDDLIVSVDQEGGKVERLRKVSPSLPSMQALGRASMLSDSSDAFDPEPIIQYTKVLASSLSELGFNMVFAPCVDLATNPLNPIIGTRSLGSCEDLVSKQSEIIIRTLQDLGIIACAKHFPGHGDTSKDSHLELPFIEFNLDLYLKHVKPFISAINSGVKSIMIAHLLIRNNSSDKKYEFDDLPTSLSRSLICDYLRQELGFDGVVVSDEITMKALSFYGNYSQIAHQMINAGNNLIIWNTNLDDAFNTALYLNQLSDSTLVENYYKSLNYLVSLKGFQKNTSSVISSNILNLNTKNLVVNAEQEMISICQKAIKNPLGMSFPSQFDIYVFNHPKLEIEVFREVFPQALSVNQYFSVEDLKPLESNDKAVLLFSFQLANHPNLQEQIKILKSKKNNLLIISVDQEDSIADIHLYGCNRAHLRALSMIR